MSAIKDKNTNVKLNKAKKDKNDEFYTQYTDIEKEIEAYLEYNPNTFKDKIILLPCDDPNWSSFTQFFINNFEKLGIKKLVSTCIASKYNSNSDKGKILIIDKSNLTSNVDEVGKDRIDSEPIINIGGRGKDLSICY